MNPDWSAALSINYCVDKPCGIMFAQETYSDKQDERYDLFTQPGGLWLRIRNDRNAAALLGKESAEVHEYFSDERKILRTAAEANHYQQNFEVCVEVEYNCHAEYSTRPHGLRLYSNYKRVKGYACLREFKSPQKNVKRFFFLSHPYKRLWNCLIPEPFSLFTVGQILSFCTSEFSNYFYDVIKHRSKVIKINTFCNLTE